MSKVIAFCTDSDVFNNNQIFDINVASLFPGALWVALLANKLEKDCIKFFTGDLVIKEILSGNYKSTDVYIIQEENSFHGQKLQELGANSFLLFCGESPIFANFFYKEIDKISEKFKFKILFSGAYNNNRNHQYDLIYYFPSFDSNAKINLINWECRKFLVMVSANKYWKTIRLTFFGILRQLLRQTRNFLYNKSTTPLKVYSEKNLHNTRLEIIEYFGGIGKLDLFGIGWNDLKNLPYYWQKRLSIIIKKIKPIPIKDKVNVISNYKFAICLENMEFEGYVTEKIIDCFRAGVIPIYLGAPDIQKFIPENLFIDLRKFENIKELHIYLQKLTDIHAQEMINKAQYFLESERGLKYSYNTFSENVYNLINTYIYNSPNE